VQAGKPKNPSGRFEPLQRRKVLGLLLTLNTIGDFPHYSAVLYPKSYRIRKRPEFGLC